MTKSYKKDIQLLISILERQKEIRETIDLFGCNQSNLEQNKKAFDLCAFYMAQIGESSKMLTDNTKKSLTCINVDTLRLFRNMIDHTYEKINRAYLKAYIFNMVSSSVEMEIKNRINYCKENSR